MKRYLKIRRIAAALVLGGAILTAACSDSDTKVAPAPEPESHLVTVLVDESYTLDYAGPLTIRGLHFADGDQIFFKAGDRAAAEASDEEFAARVEALTSVSVTVRIAPEVVTGTWSIYCRRGEETQYLGTTRLEVDIFRLVRNVRLAAEYRLDRGDRIALSGEGFLDGDRIYFTQGATKHYAIDLAATQVSATFLLPDIASGVWTVGCERGEDRQELGETTLSVTPFEAIDPASLPEGTNAYGRVYSSETALAGVYVSDGTQIVRTDDAGVYAMRSDRSNGTLFVSLPSGYEAPVSGAVPQFWALFEEGRERYDFALTPADQQQYVLLASADIQIDNDVRMMVPQSSLASCNASFVPAFRDAVNSLAGRKVYSVSLGDMVYDKYWYSRRFAFPEYKQLIGQFGVPFFHVMGNHDNDPYCADDHLAEAAYKKALGPTWYSLNIGSVHYVALDNIVYVNTGASEGVVGSTNYRVALTDRQLAWLRADLETVGDKTAPLVVWMHAPLINSRLLTPAPNASFAGADAFAALFDGFENVLILSGHWHNNHTAQYPGKPHITEHNLGSVCGSLWYNVKGFNGVNQPFGSATDGTPQGFAVYEIDGRTIRWKYVASDADMQFKAYDMNLQPYRDRTVENEILVNVWNWDAAWKVEVFEEGEPLSVVRELRQDPDYLRFVAEVYEPSGDSMTKGAAKAQTTPHIFSAVTESASSRVEVKVTDRFGEVYTGQLRE